MTSGERMVWAAEFVATYHRTNRAHAVLQASEAVQALRAARADVASSETVDDETRAMLDDMLGTGSDR